jgi:hypothetical protein
VEMSGITWGDRLSSKPEGSRFFGKKRFFAPLG